MHYRPEFEAVLHVCTRCNYHDRITVTQRLELLLDDADAFQELDADVLTMDPLEFSRPSGSYPDRVAKAQASTGRTEAVVCGVGHLQGRTIAIGVMEFGFIAGSMGGAVGERIARLFELAYDQRLPLIMVTASGGARQDEGVFALMQMAKTTAAAARLGEAGVPYISIMADPTLAGVTASFASVADVIIGEPGATIRFAGSRVVRGTVSRRAQADDHTAEWVLKRGMIDMVVPRRDHRRTIGRLIEILALDHASNNVLPADVAASSYG
jgi:acetyl-CoA carboxylase carboxyl transferase subunit beta